jgi:hypothetical protein
MSQSDQPTQLLPSTFAFFQEYDPARLDISQHAPLIIERILAYGSRAEVRWLLQTYGRSQVKDWVLHRGLQRLSWRRYHLWCLVFDLTPQPKPDRIWPH